MLIRSKATFKVSGVKLKDDNVNLSSIISKYKACDINCKKISNDTVIITASVDGEDKNENYLVLENIKNIVLYTFSLLGNRVRLESFKIEPESDYLNSTIEVGIPSKELEKSSINSTMSMVLGCYNKPEIIDEFIDLLYYLHESQQKMSDIHKFRTIFAVFDKLAPKNSESSFINYEDTALKDVFCNIVKHNYSGYYYARYEKIINSFIAADLIDELRSDKPNYSRLLKNSFNKLPDGVIVNHSIAFYVMKSIQIARNNRIMEI